MKLIIPIVTLCASFACNAQVTAPTGSYAGQENRSIKALSAEDVQAYLAGKGQGLAKAAELNSYPGPSHVLALSAQLKLTQEQVALTREVFAKMEASAVGAGKPLVDEERNLDRLFASKTITPESLSASLSRIGELQARVRAAHLEAHILQAQILTPEQVARYNQLRGYASSVPPLEHGHHQHTGG